MTTATAETTLTIQIDKNLKREVEELCSEMGITLSAAVNIFFIRMLNDGGIPFKVKAKRGNRHLYKEPNLSHLLKGIEELEAGHGVSHELIRD